MVLPILIVSTRYLTQAQAEAMSQRPVRDFINPGGPSLALFAYLGLGPITWVVVPDDDPRVGTRVPA